MFINLARSVGPSLPLISFSKPQALHFPEDDMAPKNANPQLSRKVVRSTSQGSTTSSIISSGVMTRSIAKAAAVIAMKQSIGAVPSQSRKIRSLDPNLLEGVASHPLKQKAVVGLSLIHI